MTETLSVKKSVPVCITHRREVHERLKAYYWVEWQVVRNPDKLPCEICGCPTQVVVVFRKKKKEIKSCARNSSRKG